MSEKRFLVTGGCGFIGSHLVDYLVGEGHSVFVIDDCSTGFRSNIPLENPLVSLKEDKVERLDICDFGEFDAVFHLAAQTSVAWSVENFYSSSAANLLSTLKVVEYCSISKTPMIYASSAAVYGDRALADDRADVSPESPYAADKFAIESYCSMAFRLYGLSSYGLRFFNVYGPRQNPKSDYSGVISIFANNIQMGSPIQIYGGRQTRDFIYVDDVIKGIVASHRYLLSSDSSVCTQSNLLTGKSVTINQLADLFVEIAGRSVERQHLPQRPGDLWQSKGSTHSMVSQLGLKNFIDLDEGLRKTLSWIESEDKSYQNTTKDVSVDEV